MVSIVDYMTKAGQDPSFENRKMLFNQFFPGQEFSGTAEQNQLLMGKMQDPNNPAKPDPVVDPNNPNAGNAGREVVRDGGSGQNVEGQFSKGLIKNEDGTIKSLGVTRDIDNPDGTQKGTQEFSVQQLNDQNITVDPDSPTGLTSDLSKTGYGGAFTGSDATGANSNTSNAVDFKAQKEVDDSKEELEKIKPPETLFGMASKGMDWASPHLMEGAGMGFGAAKSLLGDVSLKDNAGLDTGQGWKDLGMDALKGVGGLAAGAGGALSGGLGMAFKGLSPLMSAMGSGMHTMGRSMMGMQMPRY